MEIDAFEINGNPTSNLSVSIGESADGVKNRIGFIFQDMHLGYIDFSIFGESGKLLFLYVEEAFRRQAFSNLFISLFLDALLENQISTVWTEGYTIKGKERRLGKTQKIAEEKGIIFISGIQTC